MALFKTSTAALLCLGGLAATAAAMPTLTVDAATAAGPVSPRFYGLMTEEINHSYDGGLYAELVQNRAMLDDAKTPAHWSAFPADAATLALDRDHPLNANLPTGLRVDVERATAAAPAGVANGGYWGIPVMAKTRYRASFYAKAAAASDGPVTLSIVGTDGTVYAKATVAGLTTDWKKYEATLDTAEGVTPTTKARFALAFDRPGTVWLDLVSLFPPTYHDRPNGFRKDLMRMLVDLKPKFLRFPGGNFVEGDTLADRFDWKKTVGPLEDRPGHAGCWGYRATDGMGLLEFLNWSEDMGGEPVLAVFAGYTLNTKHIDAGPGLQPYVQDALDEIEYVTGNASTTWGKRRVKDGHPAPFPLHYVEVGNEDFFDKSDSYQGRFAQFYDAIKNKYPDLKVISSVGNEQGKMMVKSRTPDVVDEHYYRPADEFVKLSPDYYEKYQRGDRPEIFVGEWAAYEDARIKPWTKEAKKLPVTPAFKSALGDAAFMASMERNSDLIRMNCYAPLLVNVNPGAWQWRPDLIGYDAGRCFGSPSYYAIKMFSTHVGDERLALTATDTPVQASATRDAKTGRVFLKLVNPTADDATLHVDLKGVTAVDPTAAVQTMAADPMATNSIDKPTAVVPVDSTMTDAKPAFDTTVPAHGIVVMTLNTTPAE